MVVFLCLRRLSDLLKPSLNKGVNLKTILKLDHSWLRRLRPEDWKSFTLYYLLTTKFCVQTRLNNVSLSFDNIVVFFNDHETCFRQSHLTDLSLVWPDQTSSLTLRSFTSLTSIENLFSFVKGPVSCSHIPTSTFPDTETPVSKIK